ncbi:hypothetical protein [Sphingomonas sp. Leaf17]|uniref:hypothetical protein n=1 Tax=Sphingomonas sp. Leaf17 TaxID=1735683 RepID=UPI0012E259A1|nr:hypothetical protein [Sphingomonas sp. Leaf17]
MKTSFAAAIASASLLANQAVVAQSVATAPSIPVPKKCTLSQPARVVASLRDMPDVASEFRRIKLDIADIGEKYIPFDLQDELSRGLPHRQFVRAYVFKNRTIVWYLRGGFVTNFHVAELREQVGLKKGDPNVLRLTGRHLSGPPCAATEAVLAGVDGQQGW